MATKDQLRAVTLGRSTIFREAKITVGDQTIIVRELTQRERADVYKRSREQDEMPGRVSFDSALLNANAVIASCYDEAGVRVFEETDLEVLLSQPDSSGWYKKLVKATNDLMRDEDQVKNSTATTSASSS